jgi:hypothetical protein
VNRDFPVAAWGWDKYADQSTAAITARRTLINAARPA